MKLALWDTLPAEFFLAGAGAASPWTVVQQPPEACLDALMSGEADVALLPTLLVLSHTDVFDVLPAAALSTWGFPFARLVLRHGLGQVETLGYDPAEAQAALLARIVLKEHYGLAPTFVALDGASPEALLEAGHDAALIVGPSAATLTAEVPALDLGQEWYELVNYPMVWGLFCARRDEAVPTMVEALRETVKTAEAHRGLFVQSREMPPALHAFFADDLRLRFDDLATASLTELRQYFYFYHVTDDLPELPLYEMPDVGAPDDEDEKPLL